MKCTTILAIIAVASLAYGVVEFGIVETLSMIVLLSIGAVLLLSFFMFAMKRRKTHPPLWKLCKACIIAPPLMAIAIVNCLFLFLLTQRNVPPSAILGVISWSVVTHGAVLVCVFSLPKLEAKLDRSSNLL